MPSFQDTPVWTEEEIRRAAIPTMPQPEPVLTQQQLSVIQDFNRGDV